MSVGSEPPVITVDGPGGVGKGTLGQFLARHLGWHFLDSGALYRLTALAADRQGVALDDAAALARVALTLDVRFEPDAEGGTGVLLADEAVERAIRTEACGNAASVVAALVPVREALLERQRRFRQWPGLVADGRDMGTVVFPDAVVKLFLVASAEERARRRYKQLRAKGADANLAQLIEQISERDQRDANRRVSPLRPAADAEILDTTALSIREVEERTLAVVHRVLGLD